MGQLSHTKDVNVTRMLIYEISELQFQINILKSIIWNVTYTARIKKLFFTLLRDITFFPYTGQTKAKHAPTHPKAPSVIRSNTGQRIKL
jgi:hypothetical protein